MSFFSFGGDVGKRLKELRKVARLSQEQMAEKLSVSSNTVSNWETNTTEISIRKYLKYEDLAREQIEAENFKRVFGRTAGSNVGVKGE